MRIALKTGRWALGLALFAAAPARAAVITVPSPGVSTIQQGVDASFAGDTVRVKAGVYAETVTIDATKDGITLVGVGNVILDARPFFIANGPGLEVLGTGVTVKNLTIRCARTGAGGDGHGLLVDADEFVGNKITVKHCEASGIHLLSSNATLTNCRVESVGGVGIHAEFAAGLVAKNCSVKTVGAVGFELSGNTIRVEGCRVRGAGGTMIEVVGSDALIRKCLLEEGQDAGIEVTGSTARIEDCRVSRHEQESIVVVGNFAEVRRCKISNSLSFGIVVGGSNVVIENNVVRDCVAGIQLDDASDGSLLDNRITNTRYYGIMLDTCTQSTVADNVVVRCGAQGILADAGASNTIRDNVIKEAGLLGDLPVAAGIELDSVGTDVVGNRITLCGGDGILVLENGSSLTDNIVTSCGEDGIDVQVSIASVLEGNVVTACVAEGIENNATNTTLTNNVAKKNRTDLANDGTLNVVSGNVFATGSVNTDPLIDF